MLRALTKAEKPNREGLTFEEWMHAADPDLAQRAPYAPTMKRLLASHAFRKYAQAWNRGEDPTEWRAAAGKRTT